MMSAIFQQPVSVAIDASQPIFQSYTTGVITDAASCGKSIDHAVVAVGYGVDATAGAYFIVRNSWGTSWGQSGYVYIGQSTSPNGGAPGVCAINTDPYYPNVVTV
jgi:KDEL-tailed cysteine endopeptidase